MADQHLIFDTIQPTILLLFFGIIAVIVSRRLKLNPIVGYLVLGVCLNFFGHSFLGDGGTVATLSELGVVFLLFDVGLHFSFTRVRERAGDIFGFGPLQVVLGTLFLAGFAFLCGLAFGQALLVGAILSLSSTAVVARLIAERHQQSCPVGLTATAILVFQDIAAIALLIAVSALDTGTNVLPTIGFAFLKAILAFAGALLLSRVVIEPLLTAVVRSQNEETFTATALLIALSAAWATAYIGLSLSLGAFLGGMILSETPYRAVIQSEIKPFRGLLLGFFFISVGLGLDASTLVKGWPFVIALAMAILAAKIVSNMAASLIFRWSTPGSAQLGFLLAQGSEFAFVILSLPTVQAILGAHLAALLVSAVALTLAVTPSVAEAGRWIAGRLRARHSDARKRELTPVEAEADVLLVGMGERGRTIADALIAFDISYLAIEDDETRLRSAIADGYNVIYGNLNDLRLWEPIIATTRKLNIFTEPDLELIKEWMPVISRRYPGLPIVAVIDDDTEAETFAALHVRTILDQPKGSLAIPVLTLAELRIDRDTAANWLQKNKSEIQEGVAA
jgi:CPA2 family monovalent cation:H+ antiporter-2